MMQQEACDDRLETGDKMEDDSPDAARRRRRDSTVAGQYRTGKVRRGAWLCYLLMLALFCAMLFVGGQDNAPKRPAQQTLSRK